MLIKYFWILNGKTTSLLQKQKFLNIFFTYSIKY